MVQEGNIREIGEELRRAIRRQLAARGAPAFPFSIRNLHGDPVFRGSILVKAGEDLVEEGRKRKDSRMKRVGLAVRNRGRREIAVGE